jgi:hypothetical protein
MSTAASRAAYQDQVPLMRGKRAIVFHTISGVNQPGKIINGMTIREIMEALDWPHTTVSARVFELAEAGVIYPSGQVREGQTVWFITPQERIEHYKNLRAAARKAKADKKEAALERLEQAAKNIREHKAELFEDGVSADLASEGITTTSAAFKAGYDECHRIMIEILDGRA